MSPSFIISDKLISLKNTLRFFKKHFLVITGLGLIAAFGRVIQLGGFGAITSWANILLEIVIEGSRLALFLYVLGLANIKKGILRIKHFFTQKRNRRLRWAMAVQTVKKQWLSILLDIIGFLIIAWAINYLIELLAYKTCFYLSLKDHGVLADSSSEWTVLLFFKNLSVIPFTLIFETLLVLWVTKKLTSYKSF
ncbi:MAG: hypothetical protein WDN26_14055 [Chitinophagaceae bacterium]